MCITVPADPRGAEGSVGVLGVLLFTDTLLFHRTFLHVGFGVYKPNSAGPGGEAGIKARLP